MSILGDVAKAIWDEEHNGCECQARAVFKVIESRGYRIVPIEPTDAMCIELGHLERESACEAWRNTLAVAPQIDVAKEGQ